MAAAAAAGQQFALITSQGIPFIQPGIPAIYTSPAGKYILSLKKMKAWDQQSI
jgi:hypothetical protein